MTTTEAKKILILYGINGLESRRPFGISVVEAFNAAIDIATGEELDDILEESLGLVRTGGTFMVGSSLGASDPETDECYRQRAKDISYILDGTMSRPLVQACLHSWKFYQGLMETYEYCIHCDEKKK